MDVKLSTPGILVSPNKITLVNLSNAVIYIIYGAFGYFSTNATILNAIRAFLHNNLHINHLSVTETETSTSKQFF